MTAFASQMKPKLKGKDMAKFQNGLTAQHARYMADKAVRDKHAPEHDGRLNNILDSIESRSKKGEYTLKILCSHGIVDSLVLETLENRGFRIEGPEDFDVNKPYNVTIGW